MRLQPRYILGGAAALILGVVVLTLALGGELRDLPWGAIILMVVLGLVFARRMARRSPIDDMPPE